MFEIDPEDAVALSFHHAPGTCALLVGSGLSSAAGIPTGWQITLDLVRRVGLLAGAPEDTDWEVWFREKHGKSPSYSEVLDTLATSAAERRAVLQSYIEPAEGDEGRRPTKAHHAIAQLVVSGAVKVILTTNFDRLLETALQEAGIQPTVIANEDALKGAMPLVHSRCTVVKLHGDYMDARIKNTDAELASYTPEMDAFLDTVLDQFGLLVAGWSGEWDTALRNALLRSATRRYPFYWAARGAIAPLARDIIDQRGGRAFPITDADIFFGRVGDAVTALQHSSRPHPDSVAVAIALAKRYCRDEQYGLEWAEILQAQASKIRALIKGNSFPTATPTAENVDGLVATLSSVCEILRRSCLIGGRWGVDGATRDIVRTINMLWFGSDFYSGFTIWGHLRNLCASLCFYWALAGAVDREDYVRVFDLMHAQTRSGKESSDFVEVLPLATLSTEWNNFTEARRRFASAIAFALFEDEVEGAAIDRSGAGDLFDRVETLISLEYGHKRLQSPTSMFWAPVGLRRGLRFGVLDAQLQHYEGLPASHPIFQAGLLGGTPEAVQPVARGIRQRFAGVVI